MKQKVMGRYSIHSRLYLVTLGLIALFLLLKQGGYYSSSNPQLVPPQTKNTNYDFIDLPDQPKYHTNSKDNVPVAVPWAVSYSPFTANGACKPAASVVNDLREMKTKGISAVRVFSTDCNILDRLSQVPDLGIILGIQPYSQDGSLHQLVRSLTVQLEEISQWGEWSRLDMLVVGSQGVFAEEYSRADLVRMIRHVRRHVESQRGFKALITTSEPVESWVSPTKYNAASVRDYKEFLRQHYQLAGPIEGIGNSYDDEGRLIEDTDICAAVDVVSLVIQPYFNAALYPDESNRLVSRDVRFARYLCSDDFVGRAHRQDMAIEDIDTDSPSPPVIVSEAGWPHEGLLNGNAAPGLNEQRIALDHIVNARDTHSNKRIPAVLYSYYDELWRDAGDLNVEQSFGISHQYE